MAVAEDDFVILDNNDVQDFNEEGILPLTARELAKIREWLAPTDYAAAWGEYGKHRASHLCGTGHWILQTEQYRQWHNSSGSALWIKAVAGAGKSVIAASLISKLAAEEQAPVMYFFFRHIISANRKPQSLARDFLSQLLRYSPRLQHDLHNLIQDRRSLDSVSFDQMWEMLRLALAQLPLVYCVIDALDETDVYNESFLHHLVAMSRIAPSQIKVLMTSRPTPQIERAFRQSHVIQLLLQPRLVDPDISMYVHHRTNLSSLTPTMRDHMHKVMCARAGGHFLYARLMLDDLLDPAKNLVDHHDKLLKALGKLPTPMADMYTQMLLAHSNRLNVPQELQLAILQWVLCAERPLRVLELASILPICRTDFASNLDMKSLIRTACGPLLEVFEDETVHPIHHSFAEFLLSSIDQPRGTHLRNFPVVSHESAHKALAVACMRYLTNGWHKDWQSCDMNQGDQKRALDRKHLKIKYSFLDYAANSWAVHVQKSGVEDAELISELDLMLGTPGLTSALVILGDDTSAYQIKKESSAIHVASSKGLSFYLEHLFDQCHDIEKLDPDGRSPLALAALNGHVNVVESLIRHGASCNQADLDGNRPIHLAAQRDHHVIVKILLEVGIDPLTPVMREVESAMARGHMKPAIGTSPVTFACVNGHEETVRVFIPYLDGGGLEHALHQGLLHNQTKVVTLLLEVQSIEVNRVIDGRTALGIACQTRNLTLMRLLLSLGADANAIACRSSEKGNSSGISHNYGCECSILHEFAGSQRTCIANRELEAPVAEQGFAMLLDAGADPKTTDCLGQPLLHRLLSHGGKPKAGGNLERILRMLLDRGISATSLNLDGSNALHVLNNASPAVIKMLVDRGVDINMARESDGRTPLMIKLSWGTFEAAKNYLDQGADPKIPDPDLNTPLHFLARSFNHRADISLVRALIEAGANVNARNKDGDTPLHLTSSLTTMLDLFLQHGYDLEARNRRGETVLFQAVLRKSPEKSYIALPEVGAKLSTRDSEGSTLLHAAIGSIQCGGLKTIDIMQFLVDKGVSPHETDNKGNTLWHRIANISPTPYTDDETAVMNLLTELGVSPNLKNDAGQLPLHIALSKHHTATRMSEPFKFILEHLQNDVNAADYNNVRPIHLTSSNNAYMTSILLEMGADPTLVTIDGQSALTIACRTRQCDIVTVLLQWYEQHDLLHTINQVDRQGRSALHYASRSGRPETVALLLQAGADPNMQDKYKLTPLHACSEVVQEQDTWDYAAKNARNTQITTAYVLMSDTTRPRSCHDFQPARVRETVRLLVRGGANTSFLVRTRASSSGDTGYDPLSMAMNKGSAAVVDELLQIQARLLQEGHVSGIQGMEDTTSDNTGSRTPQSIMESWKDYSNAVKGGIWLANDCYQSNSISNTTHLGTSNLDLVRKFLQEDDEPAVMTVAKSGATFLELDSKGDNALYRMVAWGFADLLRLVGQDAVHMTAAWAQKIASQRTQGHVVHPKPILEAALSRSTPNMEIVKVLVSHFGLDPHELYATSTFSSNTQSYLHLLATPSYRWQNKALEYFLQNGANIEICNSAGNTPLITALRNGHNIARDPNRSRAIEILLRYGANPNVTDSEGLTCLNIAAKHPKHIELLLKYGANPAWGDQPLIFDLIMKQDIDTLETILGFGVDVNVLVKSSSKLVTQMTGEQRRDRSKVAPGIRRHRPKYTPIDEFSKSAYPIHVAASKFFNKPETIVKASKIIQLLLDAKADPFLTYDNGVSIMHALVEQGGMFEPFMHLPGFDLESRDEEGRTLLLAACDAPWNGQESSSVTTMPISLLAKGAIVNAIDLEGRNAVHHLINSRVPYHTHHADIEAVMEVLLPPLAKQPDCRGQMPLHYAVAQSYFDLIEPLLDHGADPLQVNPVDGTTVLHHIAPCLINTSDIILYESRKVFAHLAESSKQTSLTAQTDSSIDPQERNKHFKPEELTSVLQKSARRYFTNMLARGVSINAKDDLGETPLFKLMEFSLTTDQYRLDAPVRNTVLMSALHFLEQAGADFRVRNHAGGSVLHKMASWSGSEEEYKRRKGCIYKEPLQRKLLPTKDDLKDSFMWLVDRGVDVAWEDCENRTCLDVAAACDSEWLLKLFERQ